MLRVSPGGTGKCLLMTDLCTMWESREVLPGDSGEELGQSPLAVGTLSLLSPGGHAEEWVE